MPGSALLNRSHQRTPALLSRTLVHTCTRTPVNDGALDAWNQPAPTSGTPETLAPCYYSVRTDLSHDERGRIVVRTPIMLVRAAQPLAVGDLISAVVNRRGETIEPGPLTVDAVESIDHGSTLYKRARLRRAGGA